MSLFHHYMAIIMSINPDHKSPAIQLPTKLFPSILPWDMPQRIELSETIPQQSILFPGAHGLRRFEKQ